MRAPGCRPAGITARQCIAGLGCDQRSVHVPVPSINGYTSKLLAFYRERVQHIPFYTDIVDGSSEMIGTPQSPHGVVCLYR